MKRFLLFLASSTLVFLALFGTFGLGWWMSTGAAPMDFGEGREGYLVRFTHEQPEIRTETKVTPRKTECFEYFTPQKPAWTEDTIVFRNLYRVSFTVCDPIEEPSSFEADLGELNTMFYQWNLSNVSSPPQWVDNYYSKHLTEVKVFSARQKRVAFLLLPGHKSFVVKDSVFSWNVP